MASGTQVQAGGFTPDCFADLQRPGATTTYAADEHVAQDAVAAGGVSPLKFPAVRNPNGAGIITGARLCKSTATVDSAGFRLWLWNNQPFAAGAYPLDNAALVNQYTFTALQSLIGWIDFATADFLAHSASASCEGVPNRPCLPFTLRNSRRGSASTDDFVEIAGVGRVTADRLVYGTLSTLGAYVPGALERFRVTLDVQQD